MTVEEAVRTILLADPTVSGIVGTRIFPIQLPLICEFPAISYLKPSNPFSRISGRPRVQIDCWTEDYLECLTLAKAVETALDGYSGTVAGVNIRGIFPQNAPDQPIDDAGLFHIPYDFFIHYIK